MIQFFSVSCLSCLSLLISSSRSSHWRGLLSALSLRGVGVGFPVSVNRALLRLVNAFVGMRAEEVALGLRQVLREIRRAVAVKVGEARRHGERRNAVLLRGAERLAPVRLRL